MLTGQVRATRTGCLLGGRRARTIRPKLQKLGAPPCLKAVVVAGMVPVTEWTLQCVISVTHPWPHKAGAVQPSFLRLRVGKSLVHSHGWSRGRAGV